ncbi:MAG: addiction module protein [Bryobacteraceae bacterium]|nr:addiction module protein [Bryobacteraceae bacterium]
MSEQARSIVAAAVALPEDERSFVVDALLDSMSALDDAEGGQRLYELASRRAEELVSGAVAGIPADIVHGRLAELRGDGR